MNKSYDVIIVGGGPAGCSSAVCLASYGYEVLLLEKNRFPRDKVCGDGLSPPALEVLARLGVYQRIMDQNPWRVDSFKVFSPAGEVVNAGFSQLEGAYQHGLIMPRRELDSLLWQRARSFSNVQALEDCRVLDLSADEGRFLGVKARCGEVLQEFTAPVMIGADGAHSLVARKFFPAKNFPSGGALGIRAYFEGVPGLTRAFEVHCEKLILPAYGWIFPTGEDTANVGVGISPPFLKKKNIRKLFQEFVELDERLRRARLVENSWKGWPIPLAAFFARRSRQNVLLVGDAGHFADFLTGEGVYYALRSGECAADAVHAGWNFPGRIGEIYERLWRKAFPYRECLFGKVLRRLILTEFFMNFNVRRARKNPLLARNLAAILCHQKARIRLLF